MTRQGSLLWPQALGAFENLEDICYLHQPSRNNREPGSFNPRDTPLSLIGQNSERCQDDLELCCLSGLISLVSVVSASELLLFFLEFSDLTAAPRVIFLSFPKSKFCPKLHYCNIINFHGKHRNQEQLKAIGQRFTHDNLWWKKLFPKFPPVWLFCGIISEETVAASVDPVISVISR